MKPIFSFKDFFSLHTVKMFAGLLLLFSSLSMQAQETVVVGQVLDKADRAPLAAVNVQFKGSAIYAQTNEEGYFLIRSRGKESVLVFSLIGYGKEEIRVTPGESTGTEILMEEKINLLGDLLVTPGANPANDLMKKVQANRKKNNVRANLKSREQHLVLLSKKDSRWENNRLFEQFKSGNLSTADSLLIVPLYMEESVYTQSDKRKELLQKNTFNSSETTSKLVDGLLQGLHTDINFYGNAISVLGKSLISPLAGIGKTYYRYYLLDSIQSETGKEYLLRFRSKNTKNLAFNGEMRIDSATLALTYINAELPQQANLNFIHNLRLNQSFGRVDSVWIPASEYSAWNMTYELLKENRAKSPELLISNSADYSPEGGRLVLSADSFARADYSIEELEAKLAALRQAPLYKTAAYVADALMTGYARAGIIDIGQLVDITRLTKIEGVRVGLPFRTNERLWKNVMIGVHPAYGFRDKELKYSGTAQWKLPVNNNRIILGASYLNDYRRIDYDYNNFLWREDPLATGDENFVSTFFAFRAQHRISKRKEITAFVYNDWSPDIESKWIYRDVTYLPNELLPLNHAGESFTSLRTRNVSFTTRFSFGERVVEEHFQRIYLKSFRPIIYVTLDGGQYAFGENSGNFGRISGTWLQRGQFMLGEWRYMVDAGRVLGDVPYPLLKFIQGKDNGAYNRFEFALMNSREYIADTYGTLFTELILNGVLFNNIPLIKHLNLREIASFKMAYGTLGSGHAAKMDIPAPSGKFTQPYTEASLGFCNLLGVMSVQSIWRLSDLDKPDIKKWGIKFNIMLTF